MGCLLETTFEWVTVAAAWCVIVVSITIDMLYMLWNRWRKKELPESISLLDYNIFWLQMRAFLVLLTVIMFNLEPVNEKQHMARIIAVACCLYTYLYVIIRNKLASGLTWEEYIMKKTSIFLMAILRMRGWIQRVYLWKGANKARNWIPGAIWILSILAMLAVMRVCPEHRRWAAIGFVGVMLVYSLLFGLQSCRSIFSTWFCTIVVVVTIARETTISDMGTYVAAMIITAIVCMFTGALANYDTAKLAMNIINTGTTLIVMVVNVLASWTFLREEINSEILTTIQFWVNLGVLPYAIVGYVTALFKDIQVYWEEHYLRNVPPGTRIVKIRDWIYSPKKDSVKIE